MGVKGKDKMTAFPCKAIAWQHSQRAKQPSTQGLLHHTCPKKFERASRPLPSQQMLAAGDEDFGAGDVGEVFRAEAIDHSGDVFRAAHAV